jgi:Ca2+-binding RTX toxin-like protein
MTAITTRCLTAAVSALALAAWAPSPALAGTAHIHTTTISDRFGTYTESEIDYDAAPGEQNTVTVASSAAADGPVVTFTDPTAPVVAGDSCMSAGIHEAVCTPGAGAGHITAVGVQAGDGNDSVDFSATAAQLPLERAVGGEGADTLSAEDAGPHLFDGGPGADTLTGGSGADTLLGGAGSDALHGGASDDVLNGDGSGADPAADSIDGGPGSDRVSYVDRHASVTVDLEQPAAAGQPGEHDTLSSIENIEGGLGADVLRGDDGPNQITGGGVLDGRGGDDRLFGSRGPDRLLGGSGRDYLYGRGGGDRYSGGPGNDRLSLFDSPGADFPACGAGGDRVEKPTIGELVGRDCERVSLGDLALSAVRTVRGSRVAMRVLLPGGGFTRYERVALYTGQRHHGRYPRAGLLGTIVLRWSSGGSRRVTVPLLARGREAVRSGRHPRVHLVLESQRRSPDGSRLVPSGFFDGYDVRL